MSAVHMGCRISIPCNQALNPKAVRMRPLPGLLLSQPIQTKLTQRSFVIVITLARQATLLPKPRGILQRSPSNQQQWAGPKPHPPNASSLTLQGQ